MPLIVTVLRGDEATVALQRPHCGAAKERGVAGAARHRRQPRLGATNGATCRHPALRALRRLRGGGAGQRARAGREAAANRKAERARGGNCSPISARHAGARSASSGMRCGRSFRLSAPGSLLSFFLLLLFFLCSEGSVATASPFSQAAPDRANVAGPPFGAEGRADCGPVAAILQRVRESGRGERGAWTWPPFLWPVRELRSEGQKISLSVAAPVTCPWSLAKMLAHVFLQVKHGKSYTFNPLSISWWHSLPRVITERFVVNGFGSVEKAVFNLCDGFSQDEQTAGLINQNCTPPHFGY